MKTGTFTLFMAALYRGIDFLVLFAGMLASYRFYRLLNIGRQVYYPDHQVMIAAVVAAASVVVVIQIVGGYRRESSLLNVNEIKAVCKGVTISYLVFAVFLYFGTIYLSRYTLAFSYVLSLVLLVIERTALYHLLPVANRLSGMNKKILIYGAGELGRTLYRNIVNSPKMGITPVGFIDDDPDKAGAVFRQAGFNCKGGICVLGDGAQLDRIRKQYNIDEVWVAISNVSSEVLLGILENIRRCGLKPCFIPNLYRLFVHRIRIFTIGDLPVVEEVGQEKKTYLYVKRYLDLALAVVVVLLLWPLMLAIALAIKIDSPGPVIFTHDRVGKDGRIFTVYKFRTMHRETDPLAPSPTSHEDPRITRVGRFLRKTSLDEIPQIFNILKGDMSFVGPRPEMPFIVENYTDFHRERLKMLPGLTGMWQLSGDRGRAIHENMDYDLYYIRHVSFFLDVAILIETLIFAFRGI